MSFSFRHHNVPRSRITSTDSGFASTTYLPRTHSRPRSRLGHDVNPSQQMHPNATTRRPTAHGTPTQAQDIPPSQSKRPLLKLSDLECIKALGEGGWAKVLLVQPKRDNPALHTTGRGSLLALKSIEKRFYRDNERNDDGLDRVAVIERRNQELRCLTSLPWSPFVTGLVDAYTDPRNVYFMLEFAPGGSLHDYMREHGRLSTPIAEFYFANMVLGIEFLHTHGIVHRDIKDENILIGADGYLMITDFGLSQFVDEGERWDRLGTVPFMSYEVAKKNNDSHEARYASDWWGASVILFEMLVDCLPFSGRDCDTIAQDHELVRIQFPKEGALSPKLEQFFLDVFKCDLHDRLGARTEPRYKNGSHTMTRLNVQLREHEWLRALRWDRIEKRIELAPFVPDAASRLTQELDDPSMPEQRKVPGLSLKRPRDCFERDDGQNAEEVFRAKRKRATQTHATRGSAVPRQGPSRARMVGLVPSLPSPLECEPGTP